MRQAYATGRINQVAIFFYNFTYKKESCNTRAATPCYGPQLHTFTGLAILYLIRKKVTSLIIKKFASLTVGPFSRDRADHFAHLPNHICTHTRTIRDSCFKALFGEQHFLSNLIPSQLYTMDSLPAINQYNFAIHSHKHDRTVKLSHGKKPRV